MENKELVTRVTVYMPKDLKKKVDEYCEEKHFSRSELCNFALKQFFADYNEMLDQTKRMIAIMENENVKKLIERLTNEDIPDVNQLDFETVLRVVNK